MCHVCYYTCTYRLEAEDESQHGDNLSLHSQLSMWTSRLEWPQLDWIQCMNKELCIKTCDYMILSLCAHYKGSISDLFCHLAIGWFKCFNSFTFLKFLCSERSKNEIKCNICEKVFGNKDDFMHHKMSEHAEIVQMCKNWIPVLIKI